MKITVNYTENEIVETVNTIADVANELASSVGSSHKIEEKERDRVVRRFRTGEFHEENHSPAVDVVMTDNALTIDIKNGAYLDALKLVMKFTKVLTPVIGGVYHLLKGLAASTELLKEHYNKIREKWTVKEDAKRYVVASVGYEGMKFRVICCNDGYNKSVYMIRSNTMSDAADSFTDVLFNLYSEKVKEFDDSVFTLTKEEADAKSMKW